MSQDNYDSLSHKLARISYNSAGWRHPTGDAGSQESDETFNAQNRFGYEDWLFRDEWRIGGWRYAFIQGFNSPSYGGRVFDVTLYTVDPDKRSRLVATIYGIEGLSPEQAHEASQAFRSLGWLKTMEDDIVAIGGNADALEGTGWAPDVLNVRFHQENVVPFPSDTYFPDDEWIRNRRRYKLYDFDRPVREEVDAALVRRQGTVEPPAASTLIRRVVRPVVYTPEHQVMQAKLVAELRETYPEDQIICEEDYVDVRVATENELIFFEIKTDLVPRSVIRQALGQILEYAYHPGRYSRRPDSLVLVGRRELDESSRLYLEFLKEQFGLPLEFRVIRV